MGNKFKDKKQKRKRGKKFVYKDPTQITENKKNPFEELSKKKSIRINDSYNGLKNSYKERFSSNSFIDKRIGEYSKDLSIDDKMKLRFKAQQMINIKKKKNKYSLEDENDPLNILTHKGKRLEELNDKESLEKSDDDEYYERMDNYMQEMDNKKLSKKEIMQNIINKSKMLKLEKQNLKNQNKEKIELLDDNFQELSMLLKKRGRTFGKAMDKYDKNVNSFVHSEKTHPTERIKTEAELQMEKELAIKKQQINNNEDDENIDVLNAKKLTKRERIEKIMEERLKRNEKKDNDKINVRKNKSNDDNLSDLEEFYNENGEGYEDEEGGEEEDDPEDADDIEGEDEFDDEDDFEGEDDFDD